MTAVVSQVASAEEAWPAEALLKASVPHAVYRRRQAEFAQKRDVLKTADRRLSLLRAGLFVVGFGLLVLSLQTGEFAWWWCLLPAAGFFAAVVKHELVSRELERCERGESYHSENLDRLEHRWHGVGAAGERYVDEQHPYECDLDLFGKGSLFQLLCRARTRLGEDVLADWLRSAATPSAIEFRQRAISELRERVGLRESLALLPAAVHDGLDQNLLHEWALQRPQVMPAKWLIASGVLGASALVAGFGWLVLGWPLAILASVAIAELLLHFALKDELHQVAHEIDRANSGLTILAQVLSVLEAEQFQTPFLAALRSQLDSERHVPSWQIRRLQNLAVWLDSALHNQFFALLAFLTCLPIFLTHAVERWRANVGPHIKQWLDAVGQFEALSSLAGYAYEHSDDPFPEVVSADTVFEAEGLGHPLIPAERCIRNDLRFGSELRLVMISGSNMSGKSTLLRTVGSNVVLALCGAPVRARKLRLSPVVLATAMRVHDSLLEGSSLFFAVISRLKGIVERTGGPTPLLFLIDEILPGTNSHDRRVGAEAIIRQLLDRGALGLVTTHDLTLTEIVNQLGPHAVNVHFEDRLEDGRMTFDYQLRPGVVRRSNALALMQLIGLAMSDSTELTSSDQAES